MVQQAVNQVITAGVVKTGGYVLQRTARIIQKSNTVWAAKSNTSWLASISDDAHRPMSSATKNMTDDWFRNVNPQGGPKLLPEYKPGGALAKQEYPPFDGFLFGYKQTETLNPGTLLQRYGPNTGNYLSPAGTPFEKVALPGYKKLSNKNLFRVVQPLDVDTGLAAPWYGQPGMGIQFKTTGEKTVGELIKSGFLEQLN